MVGLHTLKKSSHQKTKRRVGRGGKRGKTSGRGHKGQKQHGGHGIRPELRDVIKKLPKRRGYGKNRARTVNSSRVAYTPVNLSQLEAAFSGGDTVNPATLIEKGIITTRAGTGPRVKILGRGELKKRVDVGGCMVSEAAKTAIEKAGGSVTI
jgi:large subunit ribosomal protein L15